MTTGTPTHLDRHRHIEIRAVPPGLAKALAARFGHQVSLQAHVRRLYGYDATGLVGMPDGVIYPRNIADIADAVRIAAEFQVPVVGRGAGTGLSGGAVPESGGLVISFEHMRRVLSIDAGTRRVRVEPGVVNQSLEAELAPLGLFFAPDPSSHRVSTLGGNIAENSGGPRALKYGVTGNHVYRLRVVDAAGRSGELIGGEWQTGCDLVSLVVGSEGTLALIAAAELNLEPLPEQVTTLLVSFAAMGRATDFVSAVIAEGMIPSALEFMDRSSIEKIETWGVATYAPGAAAVLLLDIDGTPVEISAESERLRALATDKGALDVRLAHDAGEREALWLGRRGVYGALARDGKHILIQDVTVPRDRLTAMLGAVARIAAKYELHTSTVGHAGDGNLHPDFPYDPSDSDMVERVHRANTEILQACVAMDGSITGEHGIGSDKLHQLPLMYGPAELGLMSEVKRSLDLGLILNPGKAIPLVPRMAIPPAGVMPPVPRDAEHVRECVLAARSSHSPLSLRLTGLRGIRVDEANLVVEVAAGETVATIEEVLAGSSLHLPVAPLREQRLAHALLLNDYGPNHARQGLFRHCLLAATYVTGYGEIVRMGRPVVKNVAGYDLFRLLIGSRGRLGVPVSFTFRLAPRDPGNWYTPASGYASSSLSAAGVHPLGIFGLPQDGDLRLYARLSSPPAGWTEADEAEALLTGLGARSAQTEDLLDLALPPAHLSHLLGWLPQQPLALLPLAARILVRLDRADALSLFDHLAAHAITPIRALYGRTWEPLRGSDPLPQEWETRLQRVFDPDGILGQWLFDP